MSRLLFKLNGVPPDEAAEVRELLTRHGIDYYETDAGRWGISVAALWLRDEAQFEAAHRLLDHYGEERARRAREALAELREAGRQESFFHRLAREPVLVLAYAVLIALVLYLSVAPFVLL